MAYISVNSGWLFDRDAFVFDADPWELRADSDFDGVSVVFKLPVCQSYANLARVVEILEANPLLQAALQAANEYDSGPCSELVEISTGFYEVRPVPGSTKSPQRQGFVRMDYDIFRDWMEQRLAAYSASGNYGADVIAMLRADYMRDLAAIRSGYYMYIFEDADGTSIIRVLHNPANGEFFYRFGTNDEGEYIKYGTSGIDVFFAAPLNQ